MAKNVLVIGIDSVDSKILLKFLDDLPNFKRLCELSPKLKMSSVFPPDSDTAWASIYTGLNPANHGIIDFVDPLEKAVHIQSSEVDPQPFIGKTFWDIASNNNKISYSLLPHICYPPWKINGTMVSRSKINDSVISSKKIELGQYNIDNLNTPKGVPRKDDKSLSNLINRYKTLLQNESDFFTEMITNTKWNLFFVYSSALDAIQHYFWNYCDENDIEYPGDNPFKNVIKEFYILYDQMVGRLMDSIDNKNTATIVLSDHGHGRRPINILNINEILHKYGYLQTNENFAINGLEKMKIQSAELINKLNLGWLISKILKYFPQSKELYSKPLSIDWNSTLAYTTDLSGIKAYTYGGIIINKSKFKNEDEYQITRNKIISVLSEIFKKDSNKKIIKWVKTREELYQGKNIDKYPDILIQLEEGYGIGHRVNSPIIDKTCTSSVVPGSHKGDTPIFFISNSNKKIKTDTVTLMDIAPTVLDLLGVQYDDMDFDGTSIFKKNVY